jgi:hypothetical protein|tara:strand:- start:452 stop:745 length:294 start_codon:yes stop_codon:yes gene_type:complete
MSFTLSKIHKRYFYSFKIFWIFPFKEQKINFKISWRSCTTLPGLDTLREVTRPIKTGKYARVLSVSVMDEVLDTKDQTSLERETISSVKVNVNPEFL